MVSSDPPDTAQGMIGTATLQTHTRDRSPPPSPEKQTPTIEPKPDAAACGSQGCTHTENLARVSNVLDTPRVLCPECVDEFLAKNTSDETEHSHR
jgi:hypothetical protein